VKLARFRRTKISYAESRPNIYIKEICISYIYIMIIIVGLFGVIKRRGRGKQN
jgi:hypothetical protein